MKQKSRDIALRVNRVAKNFQLPHEKTASIKSAALNMFRKKDKSVETQHALKDISFEIEKGEFFGILGRNGSGKSTLLKILAEIYQPTRGSVTVKGKLVPFIELGVGFNPELTGRENVYLNGALLGFSSKEIDEKYEDIVKFAELEAFMDQKIKNYSSGMQVRLAFSVATRAEADILLVDEVLAVGDADFQRKCFDYFKSLKKLGKTVVFVTHDMGAVREYCDRALLITDGVIAHEGTAETIADEYLKLFNESSPNTTSEGDRWGNGQVRIDSIETKKVGDKIQLTVDLVSDSRGAEDYVFGYRFVNSEENTIAGGNTLNATNGKKLSIGPNKKQRLTFSILDVFGNSTLQISATVRLSDGITVCDNWERAAQIRITKQESHYPVIAHAELKVTCDE
jgi:ABC-2 type transport system ATP-binding protein